MIALMNRVHMFAHPKHKDTLSEFFTATLGCRVLAVPPGSSPLPPIIFTFPNGSSLSVEFTEDIDDALDEKQARRGAWLELETDEPAALKTKILATGLPHFDYTKGFFYFQIPGGQVMRMKLP